MVKNNNPTFWKHTTMNIKLHIEKMKKKNQ